jgi:hypothetical protein
MKLIEHRDAVASADQAFAVEIERIDPRGGLLDCYLNG